MKAFNEMEGSQLLLLVFDLLTLIGSSQNILKPYPAAVDHNSDGCKINLRAFLSGDIFAGDNFYVEISVK